MFLTSKEWFLSKITIFRDVKRKCTKSVIFLCCIVGFLSSELRAQLGFCTGNSGTPIFTEDFGTGLTDGPELPAGTTTYDFVTGTPNDGQYTISSTTDYFDWHDANDITPGDTNGKALIVNASFTADEFYRRTVTGLCENTSYEFSSWLLNLLPQNACGGIGIPVNVRFQIWDETDTNLLAQGDTGDIPNLASPRWEQYALVFSTLPGQTSVILTMRNNSNGGCGNDLALDDISFSSCGDNILLTNDQNVTGLALCEGDGGITTNLEVTPDFSIFTSHAYQWQESADQITWTDIIGANNSRYTTPNITATSYFRTKVAEDAVNLANDLCNIVSDVFEIAILPIPDAPSSSGPVAICANEIGILEVNVPGGITVNWYDAATGGNLLLENSTTYTPTAAGTYYAESVSGAINCTSPSRTAVTFSILPSVAVTDENLVFCDGRDTVLSAGLDNVSYLWNTGETTKEITVATQGEYSVTITNPEGCSALKTIVLMPAIAPIINDIRSEGSSILVLLENDGPYAFALGDGPFQESPIFENITGGLYTVNIRYGDDCGIIGQEYIHVVIPLFFTPNADGNNDFFTPEGLELFPSFELSIFNRFGQLLKHSGPNDPNWDGTFNGAEMPADTYWYQLTIEELTRNGYFALKR